MTEQHLPAWERQSSNGIEYAISDVVLFTPERIVYVDISVAEAETTRVISV